MKKKLGEPVDLVKVYQYIRDHLSIVIITTSTWSWNFGKFA